MRDACVVALSQIAENDPNMVLVTADLGFGVFTEFSKKFPKQFINVGVAEQQLIGFSVGMALEGKTVFAYSLGNFPTFRCLEQIRNDACYHQANVKIVTSGGGLSYGPLGFSHHATEDISILRSLANMTIISPADPNEANLATHAVYKTPGPHYLRLGRNGETQIPCPNYKFEIGKAITFYEGDEILFISTGGLLKNALEAREILSKKGLSVGVCNIHTIKPFDVAYVRNAALRYKLIVTIEEHSIIGGLGSAVAEVLAEIPNSKSVLKRMGVPESPSKVVGNQEYLRELYGLSTASIADNSKSYFQNILKAVHV